MIVKPGDWVLFMNDMRSPNIECHQAVCVASTRGELEEFLASERVEPYTDGRWGKAYRQGGPLEWMNALEPPDYEGYGFRGMVQYDPPFLPSVHELRNGAAGPLGAGPL